MELFAINHEFVAFVVAAVAVFRKYYPRIDGAYVPIAALAIALVLSVGYRAAAGATAVELLGAALMAFKVAVAAVGGAEFVRWTAGKIGASQ